MSTNSSVDVPDTLPPPIPDTPPPSVPETSSSTLRSSFFLSPPEKPPRAFSEALVPGDAVTPSPDSSPTPSSFRTPPDSLIIVPDSLPTPPSDESQKLSSDESQKPSSDESRKPSSDESQKPSSDESQKPSSNDSSHPSSEEPQKSSADESQNPSSDPAQTPAPNASERPSVESPKNTPADVPSVSVVPAEGDSTADDVFLDTEDQNTVLLRKSSFRHRGPGETADSKLKRVVSARIDRIGSAISRFLDRDKNVSSSDRERPKSMGSFETRIIRSTDDNADTKLVPYGSNFLRRSFRQKSYEVESEDGQSTASDAGSVRRSVYNEDLVASLVCSACAHYMVAPIEQCKRGHNICKFCRRRAHQHRCPVCGFRLSGIRNRVAEDMARKLLFPCVHAHAGCTRQVPNDELEFHEPRCPFRVYHCLINVASGVPCKWEGRRVELEEHVQREHPRYYSAQETTKWRWSPNLLVKMEDFQLISAFGELFWYCATQDPERLRVCWFVQHVGYDQDSVRFEFRFVFAADEKDRRLEMTCTTLPDYTSVGSIVESGRCLDMSYQQALSFVDEEGTIKFSVTMYKLE